MCRDRVGGARRLERDGDDCRPARALDQAAVLIAALGPGDTEAVLRGANDARNLDRDLKLPDPGEGIVGPGIALERLRAGGTRALLGSEPHGADPDRTGGAAAESH